jgi:hypothetical protein
MKAENLGVRSSRLSLAFLVLGGLLAVVAGAAASLRFDVALLLLLVSVVVGLASLIWWRPFLGIMILVWLAPLHSLMLAGMVSVPAIPRAGLEAFKLWRVALALLLLMRAWWPTRRWPRVTWLDIAIGLFILVEIVFLFLPPGPGLTVRLFAIQFDSLFFAFYFLGRFFPYTYRQFRWIVGSLVAIGVLAGLFALIEVTVFRDFLFRLRPYFAYLGSEVTRRLPTQFYSFIGGVAVQRPGSLYLNPIEFSFALLLPLLLVWALGLYNAYRPARRLWLALLVMLGGLAFALSRSAFIGLALGLGLVLLARQRMPRWFLALLVVLLLAATVVAGVLRLDRFLLDTINVAEPSARGHLSRWQQSLETMQEAPLGLGLGSIGPVARRFVDRDALINESWYFQIASEMGIPAGLLFALIMLLLIVQSLLIWPTMPDRFLRATVLGVAGAATALSITALFLHTWSYDAAAIPFWLLAGLVIQLPERVRSPDWKTGRVSEPTSSSKGLRAAGHGGGA